MLDEVIQTDALHQQVAELSRHAEELQQRAKLRLLTLQDAAKVIHNSMLQVTLHKTNIIRTLQWAMHVPIWVCSVV